MGKKGILKRGDHSPGDDGEWGEGQRREATEVTGNQSARALSTNQFMSLDLNLRTKRTY